MCKIGVDMETNECLENNGGCWKDNSANITACKVFIIFLNLIAVNGKLI